MQIQPLFLCRPVALLVLLAAVATVMPVAAASAAPRHRHLLTCVVAPNPVESTMPGVPTTVTIGSVQYSQRVVTETISENLRVYAPSRHCTHRGPFTRISETDTYTTEIKVPVPPSAGNTIVVETIRRVRDVTTAHSHSHVETGSTTTQEVVPASGIGTAYGPVSGGGAQG